VSLYDTAECKFGLKVRHFLVEWLQVWVFFIMHRY